MQKDVIYIDTEDDITSIIGKVKDANSKIVALVPPKRVGVLQSAVNLKLLQKAAVGVQKRAVLITNDHSLIALAAGVKMPVAKNLQSKPEVPQMDSPLTNDEEVIDGQTLPVGDFASSIGIDAAKKKPSIADEISEKLELGEAAVGATQKSSEPLIKPKPLAQPKTSGKMRIPNFNTFRKRFFLIAGGVALLVVFLIWALVFAPRATVTISAKTSAVNVDKVLTLDPALQQSDPGSLSLKPVVHQVKKPVATEFDATGSKEIGNKAIGSITVRNCDYPDGFSLPAGSRFTASSGQQFVSTATVNVPEFTGLPSTCTLGGSQSGKANVSVEAAQFGPEYNLEAQVTYTVNGVSGEVDGVGAAMSGGTRETVKVVSQEDIDKARNQLPQADETAARAELKEMFNDGQIIIEESFEVSQSPQSVSPNVGEQASRAKLTQETTFTLTGLERSDVGAILRTSTDDALKDKPDQQAYGYGEDTIVFQSYQKLDNNTVTSRMVTTAYIGPKIDSGELAKQLEGKRYGEIQATVNQIPGVENVEINFSPFWVTTAPQADKIQIEFTVNEEQ